MLELQNASKSFGPIKALLPTSLSIVRGQTTAIIGPSGCGKSTLIRLLIGILEPDRGGVNFDGGPLTRANIPTLRQRMGYVVQDGGLFPHLTARGNATIMARYLGWESARIGDRLTELAELMHFPIDGLNRFPAQLSGGQRQRVSLIRALFLDPDVLLLDEPFSALDPMIRSELHVELRSIFSTLGKTVVMVTHDIAEAGFLADTVVLFRNGKLVQSGSLGDLVRKPVDPFVTSFVNAQRSPLEDLRGEPK